MGPSREARGTLIDGATGAGARGRSEGGRGLGRGETRGAHTFRIGRSAAVDLVFWAITVYTLSPSGRTLLTAPPPPVPTPPSHSPPSQLRHLWKHYYAEMSVGVVIFVVDGNDASRLPAGEINEDVCVCVCVFVCLFRRSSSCVNG